MQMSCVEMGLCIYFIHIYSFCLTKILSCLAKNHENNNLFNVSI